METFDRLCPFFVAVSAKIYETIIGYEEACYLGFDFVFACINTSHSFNLDADT